MQVRPVLSRNPIGHVMLERHVGEAVPGSAFFHEKPIGKKRAHDKEQRRLVDSVELEKRVEREAAADERGVFPDFEGSRLAAQGLRLRNATVTSIAPTGTISILADCSSGIEPYFALAYTRHVLDGAVLTEGNPRFEAALRHAGVDDPAVLERIRASGSIRGLAGLPERLQRRFPTSLDLPWTTHLDIQEAFQRHVDNAVSKTINLPSGASRQVVRDIYRSAWQRGLKGVTVFREGCRGEAVLVRGASDDCC